eukprot:1547421-Pleurochrysis_carterae.AAC.1
MFYVVPVATNVKTIVYMGVRAVLGCSLEAVASATSRELIHTMFIVASLHYRSGRISIFGWTMTCKWGHPVANLASDGGDYTSLSQSDVSSANHYAKRSPRPAQRR